MKCHTRDFGEIDYQESDIITFSQAPFGFERYQKYLLICDDDASMAFMWLQSLEEPTLCFILLEASTFSVSYQLDTDLFARFPEESTNIFVICVIGQDIAHSTANLKSPILINHSNKTAVQFISSEPYSIKHPLTKREV